MGGIFKNKWVKIVLGVLAIFIIISVVSYLLKASKLAAAAAGDIAGGAAIEAATGIKPNRQKVCKQIAIDCESGISRVPIVGTIVWVTDMTLVTALNRIVSDNEASLCSQFFRELTSDSLKSVVEGGFMVESSRKKITYRSSLN